MDSTGEIFLEAKSDPIEEGWYDQIRVSMLLQLSLAELPFSRQTKVRRNVVLVKTAVQKLRLNVHCLPVCLPHGNYTILK